MVMKRRNVHSRRIEAKSTLNSVVQLLVCLCLIGATSSLVLFNKASTLATTEALQSCHPDGKNTLADFLGFDADAFINWLSSHENDNYYLGTPYLALPLTNNEPHPNGDSKGGTAGMQCNGFVAHALNKVGANDSKLGVYGTPFGSYVYGINVWIRAIAQNDIRSYGYETVEALLNDGKAEKGDIIICAAKDYVSESGYDKYGNKLDGHIGVFWGNNPSDNVYWHSGHVSNGFEQIPNCNQFSHIIPKADSDFLLVKVKDKGWIEGQKASSNESITKSNEVTNTCYSLDGAIYSIYNDGWGCSNKVAEMRTNAEGYMKSDELNSGTYYVKETSPSKGYALDETVYQVQVTGGKASILNSESGGVVYEKPQSNEVDIILQKVDQETCLNVPLGGAKLKDAQFEIAYYDVAGQENKDNVDKNTVEKIASKAKVKKVWNLKTDENGRCHLSDDYKISGDSLFLNSDGKPTLPLGCVAIREINAPDGYLNSNEDRYWVRSITSEGTSENVTTYAVPKSSSAFKDQVKRGDFEFVKVENGTNASYQNPLPNIPFIIRSKTTGEEHVAVTDENGQIKTQNAWNNHNYKTNKNDLAITKNANGTYSVDESKLDSEAGIWFGIASQINNSFGALPYDTYEIEELRVSGNMGYRLVTRTATIYKDKTTVNLGTIVNEVQPYGGIRIFKSSSSPTELSLKGAEFKIYSDPAMTENFLVKTIVTDETGVARTADNFDIPGNTRYWIKETKAPTGYLCNFAQVYQVWVVNQQWAQIGNTDDDAVVNTPIYGGITVEKRDIDTNSIKPTGGASLDGTKFEIVNKNDYKVFVDGNLYEKDEVVKTIETKDGFASTNEKCLPYGKYKITEVESGVGYNLTDIAPREFNIVNDGEVVDDFTGENSFFNEVISGDIKLVKCFEEDHKRMGNIPFRLTSLATGDEWEIVTDVNGEASTEGNELPYGKYKLEELTTKDNEMCKMITIDDIQIYKDKATVDLGTLRNTKLPDPTIKTYATDAEDGDKTIEVGKNVVVTDNVTFENLIVGKQYTMEGVLHLKSEDGSDAGKIEESMTSVNFTPEESSGNVLVELMVDTDELKGRELVVFEECLDDEGDSVATDADITFEGQTVTVANATIENNEATEDDLTFEDTAKNVVGEQKHSLPSTGDNATKLKSVLFFMIVVSLIFMKRYSNSKCE